MSEMNLRSDAVDVEQIMRQIRARIREKRGADYTESELQQLAGVKLEKFLDPRGIRSDLVEQFRKGELPAAAGPEAVDEFGKGSLFETHRGWLRAVRRLFRPILKLFLNPDRLAAINTYAHSESRVRLLEQRQPLYYELLHNLTVEVTRLGIENQSLAMRVESLQSRLDFDERRTRSLESVVQYKPGTFQRRGQDEGQGGQGRRQQQPRDQPPRAPQSPAGGPASSAGAAPATDPAKVLTEVAAVVSVVDGQQVAATDVGLERKRRRRRRRRRPGQTLAESQGQGLSSDDEGSDSDNQDEGSGSSSAMDSTEP